MGSKDSTVYENSETRYEGSITTGVQSISEMMTVAYQDVLNDAHNEIAEAEIHKGANLLDTYEIISDEIRGGMGSVWRVHHTSWNTDLAMKRPQKKYFSSEKKKENFIRECEAWINLGLHPNIVSCYYVREIAGVPTIFSEWMENGSLKDRISDGSLYEGSDEEVAERLLDVSIQSARGLLFSHDKNLIHQDVKPDNILLSSSWEAKIADYGLARAVTENGKDATGRSGSAGKNYAEVSGYTPAYCSPEQMDGKQATAGTDIYSWAVSVMEMYCRERPWVNGVVAGAACEEYLTGAAVRVPEELKELLVSCMKEESGDRPRDFGLILDRLYTIYEAVTGTPYIRPDGAKLAASAMTLNNRALSFIDMGMEEAALKLFDAALSLTPDNTDVCFNRIVTGIRLVDAGVISYGDEHSYVEGLCKKAGLDYRAAYDAYRGRVGRIRSWRGADYPEDGAVATTRRGTYFNGFSHTMGAAFFGDGIIVRTQDPEHMLEYYNPLTWKTEQNPEVEKINRAIAHYAAISENSEKWTGEDAVSLCYDRDRNRIVLGGEQILVIYEIRENRFICKLLPPSSVSAWKSFVECITTSADRQHYYCILAECKPGSGDRYEHALTKYMLIHCDTLDELRWSTPSNRDDLIRAALVYHLGNFRYDAGEQILDVYGSDNRIMEEFPDLYSSGVEEIEINEEDGIWRLLAWETRVIDEDEDGKPLGEEWFERGELKVYALSMREIERKAIPWRLMKIYTSAEALQDLRALRVIADRFDRCMAGGDYAGAIKCLEEYREISGADPDAEWELEKRLSAHCVRTGVHSAFYFHEKTEIRPVSASQVKLTDAQKTTAKKPSSEGLFHRGKSAFGRHTIPLYGLRDGKTLVVAENVRDEYQLKDDGEGKNIAVCSFPYGHILARFHLGRADEDPHYGDTMQKPDYSRRVYMSPDCTLVYIPVGPVFDANGAKLSDDPCFIDVRTGKAVMELETIDMQEGLALSPNNDFMFFTRNQGEYNADRGHTEVIRNSRTGREFICGSYKNFLVCEFSEDYRYIYGDVYGHGYRILYRLQWDYEPAQS